MQMTFLLFCKNSDSCIMSMKLLLSGFELSSWLKINFDKSSIILLEDNTDLQMRIENMLNCQFGSFPITYLGVPLRPRKLLHEDWQSLCRPKLIKDLQGWKGNTVSTGGRLILINSVLSSMSSYMMSFHNFLYGSLSRWIK